MIFHFVSSGLSRRIAWMLRRCRPFALVAATGALLSGCAHIAARDWELPGRTRPFQPQNYVDAGPLAPMIRRVAVLPVHASSWSAADVLPLENVFAAELGKLGRFELVRLSREELAARFGAETFDSAGAVPENFLARLQAEFGADAVLFVDLTHYAPYQPIAIGVRAKLVSIGAEPLWSFDSLFDSARPDVAEAARRHHAEQGRVAYPLEGAASTFQSPARFARYVGAATFATIPPHADR